MAESTGETRPRDMLAAFLEESENVSDLRDSLASLTGFLKETAAPDFRCLMVPVPPTPEVAYPGVEGVEEAWRDWGETFENVRIEIEAIQESEEHIVVLVSQIVVTRHASVEMRQPSAMVFAFDEAGRVARVEFHLDQDAALRTAGLEPG